MQWSDVTKAPSARTLRQFAGLFLGFFVGLAGWRVWQAHGDAWAGMLAAAGLGVGLTGLVKPAWVRGVFTAWMVAAFPIGWLVSHVALAVLFYLLFTPVATIFRVAQRDVLHRRRRAQPSYWTPKATPADVREYFRQY